MAFFGIFLANPQDFHKFAVKFHEIFLPPPKFFLRPLPPKFLAGLMYATIAIFHYKFDKVILIKCQLMFRPVSRGIHVACTKYKERIK
jgi:hypothetical protein